jgi:hypothetical protein
VGVRGGCKPGSVHHSRGCTVISLGHASPRASCDHPGGHWGGPPLAHCRVLHRMGFTSTPRLRRIWCALTAPFHPDLCPARAGGFTSLGRRKEAVWFLWHCPSASPPPARRGRARGRLTRRPAVSWHPALRCPDFPHPCCQRRDRGPPRAAQCSKPLEQRPVQPARPVKYSPPAPPPRPHSPRTPGAAGHRPRRRGGAPGHVSGSVPAKHPRQRLRAGQIAAKLEAMYLNTRHKRALPVTPFDGWWRK